MGFPRYEACLSREKGVVVEAGYGQNKVAVYRA